MPPTPEPASRSAVAAVALVICAVSLFAVMDGIAKMLAGGNSVVQVIWARYAFAVPVILLAAPPAAWPKLLRTSQPGLQFVRALMPLFASAGIITGMIYIPLADATAITFAAPLIVVALSAPLLGERVSARSWIGVVLGLAGVLVIVRPGMGAFAWAGLLPLVTAVGFALFQIMTRLVSRAGNPAGTLAWTILVGLALTTPLLPFVWRPVDATTWLLLAVSGVIFGASQYLLIRAFALAQATLLAPFTYTQIVAAILFGMAVFGEVPDMLTVAGTVVVILAGVFVLRTQDDPVTPGPAEAGVEADRG